MKYVEKLPESLLREYEDKVPPWGEVGYVTYKRTYARYVPDMGRTEEWHETCARAVNGLIELGGLFTESEACELFDFMFNLKCMVSGRALWQLGTETVRRVGSDSLQNCWLAACNTPSAFTFTFNQLMLGGGVGFNITPQYVYELPRITHNPVVQRVDTADCDFIVPDNREGWVELLNRVLDSFFVTGKPLRYSTSLIRPAGQPIKGFGGVASGSESLVKGITEIVKVLRSRVGQKLRPIDCLDIMNIIGQVVVAGNVRRSAQIAIGDAHDRHYLGAKRWDLGSIPNWRAMSNNSVDCEDIRDLPNEFWEGYRGNGEPYGLINLDNCRRFGRIADGVGYRPDPDVCGVNPCAEISLADREPCNLGELYLPNLRNVDEFMRAAKLVYKACKTISCVKFSDPDTHAIVSKNHRLGVGVTGWMAAPQFRDPDILTKVYRHIEACDEAYSRVMGVEKSNKLTTVKPSGTLSLLPANCTPGVHAAFGRYLIRRIRFSANDSLVELCKRKGYRVEPKIELDGSYDYNTMVVSFPMKFAANVTTEDQINVIDQLEAQRALQTYWSDNSVSATHYFKKSELKEVKTWLADHYREEVKTASFLLASGHGFSQAPLEKISESEYEKMRADCKPVTSLNDDRQMDHLDNLECAGGHCPIK